MGEAVIISVLCILSIFGVHKIFEMVLSLRKIADKRKMMLIYRMPDSEQNAELVVRSLAEENDTRVFVLCDEQAGQVYRICLKTASQYKNVVVGTAHDLVDALKT